MVRPKPAFDQFSESKDVDRKVAVVVLGDQLETCVAEVSQFEEGFEWSHLERDVLGKIAGIQIFDTIVRPRCRFSGNAPVLFEQVLKPMTLRLSNDGAPRDAMPWSNEFHSLRPSQPRTVWSLLDQFHVHEFWLPGTNSLLEPVAGVLDQWDPLLATTRKPFLGSGLCHRCCSCRHRRSSLVSL
jgi:hypothetical protein